MPELANVHFDKFLTEMSIAYMNESKDYIAPLVFPVVPVEKRSNKYAIYNRGTFLQQSGRDSNGNLTSIRRPGTRSTEVQWDVSNNPYYAQQLAKNFKLTDTLENYADAPIQPSIDATMSTTAWVLNDNESQVSYLACTRANYASSNKEQLVSGTTSWAQNAQTSGSYTSFPVSIDIKGAMEGVYNSNIRPPNAMALGYKSALTLSQNWEYVDRVKFTSSETLTSGKLLPSILGLEPIVGIVQYQTSAPGAASFTSGQAWLDDQGEDMALIYYKTAPMLREVSFGMTFEAPDDTLNARGFVIKRWREEWIDSERIECRTTRDWRFTSTDGSTNGSYSNGYATGGYLISGTTL